MRPSPPPPCFIIAKRTELPVAWALLAGGVEASHHRAAPPSVDEQLGSLIIQPWDFAQGALGFKQTVEDK
jgi:hypothetical protein